MADRDRPTTNQPLNARPRPKYWPILAVVGLLALIALVFVVLTTVQQNT